MARQKTKAPKHSNTGRIQPVFELHFLSKLLFFWLLPLDHFPPSLLPSCDVTAAVKIHTKTNQLRLGRWQLPLDLLLLLFLLLLQTAFRIVKPQVSCRSSFQLWLLGRIRVAIIKFTIITTLARRICACALSRVLHFALSYFVFKWVRCFLYAPLLCCRCGNQDNRTPQQSSTKSPSSLPLISPENPFFSRT